MSEPDSSENRLVREARQDLGRELVQWRDAGAPVESVMDAVDALISAKLNEFWSSSQALDNLLDAVEDVLAHDWSDNDPDATGSIDCLRRARDDFATVRRLKS